MFIQHILYSLKENGKSAIVVPTGFLTEKKGIYKKIREEICNKKMLRGVISMPGNIFANTGTNVSIMFLDKSVNNEDAILVDASKLGTKVKEGTSNKVQKTVLSTDEIKLIIETFIEKNVISEFSSVASPQEIKDKNYSFAPSQYFKVNIDFKEYTKEEFEKEIATIENQLEKLFVKNNELQEQILKEFKRIEYDI